MFIYFQIISISSKWKAVVRKTTSWGSPSKRLPTLPSCKRSEPLAGLSEIHVINLGQNKSGCVCELVAATSCLLGSRQVTEIESNHLKTLTVIWHSSFISVDSNNKTLGFEFGKSAVFNFTLLITQCYYILQNYQTIMDWKYFLKSFTRHLRSTTGRVNISLI